MQQFDFSSKRKSYWQSMQIEENCINCVLVQEIFLLQNILKLLSVMCRSITVILSICTNISVIFNRCRILFTIIYHQIISFVRSMMWKVLRIPILHKWSQILIELCFSDLEATTGYKIYMNISSKRSFITIIHFFP